MSYTIYGDPGSGAFSTEAALAEAGAEYEFHTVSLKDNEQKSAAFLAVNPSGKMPALRLPGGEIVTESAAILFAIAERFPDANLLPPSGSSARAQAMRWIVYLASEVYPMVEIVDYPERFVPEEHKKALREKARERIRARLTILENDVAGPWVLPSGFSAVDIYAAMFTRWRYDIGKEWLDAGNLGKLMALGDAVGARPRIAPIWKRHFPKG